MRLVLVLALVALAHPARADIYSYEDKEGVVHFTNVAPPRGGGHHWTVLYKTGPGKAGMISGAAGPTSFAGCAVSRADVVPATDHSADRYTRYDQYIANAEGKAKIQEFWRTVKRQEQENVQKLKELIAEEIKQGCF